MTHVTHTNGSSPRAWGTLNEYGDFANEIRFIPTCMGNAMASRDPKLAYSVHPHVHGERREGVKYRRVGYGSSPRAWGTLLERKRGVAPERFIPTCMGNALPPRARIACFSVHPHVHGER